MLDDDEPITEEWLRRIVYQVKDPTSVDSHLFEIGKGVYIVVEADFSVAIQEGMYDDKDSQYIALPGEYKTRGALRRLAAALGITLVEGGGDEF